MSRYILSSAILALTFMSSSAQLVETPLVSNPHLVSLPEKSRSMQQEDILLYVVQNGDVTICAESFFEGLVGSVTFEACSALQAGSIDVEEHCMTYSNNGSLELDRICARVCDTLDNCSEFALQLIPRASIRLPFVDDFSYSGPYPDDQLWLDQDVFINNSLAERPLGLGVATFDGLDPTGTPYDRPAGTSDLLTSTFIDASRSSNVYVSFFYQPRGFGIRPRMIDSLALDVKAGDGSWINLWAQAGLPDDFTRFDPAPPFEFVKVSVPDSILHAGFQIRFRNRSQQLGLQQIWHIDYIRVTEDLEPERTFEDIAFRAVPTGILRHYTAMPYRHFFNFEDAHVRDSFDISLYNHFPGINNANPSQLGLSRTGGQGTIIDNLALLLPAEISPDGRNQRNLSAGQHDFRNGLRRSEILSSVIALASPEDDLGITMHYSFQQDRESNQGIAAFLRNNTTTFTNRFENFFAYDDGSAESGLKAENNTGTTTLAQEFICNVDDRLQGVQLFFPRVEGDADRLRFDLMVWIDSLDEEPDFLMESVQPIYADEFFDTLQGYTTYPLIDTAGNRISLDLPAGRFYVGWQQVKSTVELDLSMGFDKNHPDATDFTYVSINGAPWRNVGETIQTIKGALMIRPILDDVGVIPTQVDDRLAQNFTIFPNPTTDILYIQDDSEEASLESYQIYGIDGRLMYFGQLNKPEIDVSKLGSGSYFVVVTTRAQKSFAKKFQIAK